MYTRSRQLVAGLVLAVFSTTSLLGVGLHLCVGGHHLDWPCQRVCAHSVCAHGHEADHAAPGQASICLPDHNCPVCQFLCKWQSPATAHPALELVLRVTIVSEVSATTPLSPSLPGYLARAPPPRA